MIPKNIQTQTATATTAAAAGARVRDEKTAVAASGAGAGRGWWLFSPSVDLAAFLGSAVVSLALLWVGARVGVLDADAPDWTWIPAVLLVDVAHVYATAFRVYLDTEELKRRLWLYALVPLIGYGVGAALYSEGEWLFWRVLAYLAVFHFVRQQYGWVALYRARAGERGRWGWWIDTTAVYAATVYPLIYWHAHLPRRFNWFLSGDFAALPALVERVAEPLYWTAMGAYALRSAYAWLVVGRGHPGKDIVVGTTALCWYVGIVWFDSDYAFTVTNVVIHGVPYMVLVYWYARRRREATGAHYRWLARSPFIFLATLWLLAYAEELLWDRGLWHERGWLFGAGWEGIDWLKTFFVPLLALPQITHYVLDGFVWRRAGNPGLSPFETRETAGGSRER